MAKIKTVLIEKKGHSCRVNESDLNNWIKDGFKEVKDETVKSEPEKEQIRDDLDGMSKREMYAVVDEIGLDVKGNPGKPELVKLIRAKKAEMAE